MFRVSGSAFEISGSVFQAQFSKLQVSGSASRVLNFGFRGPDFEILVSGFGFQVP